MKKDSLNQLTALFLMMCCFNVNADDLKVLRKIEFHKTAPKKLIDILLKELKYNDPIPKEVYYETFDLNNDKNKEYFFYFSDSGWCGSLGCKMLVFSKHSLKINLLFGVTGGEIYVLNDKTGGYYDLIIRDSKANSIFRWNGSYYKN